MKIDEMRGRIEFEQHKIDKNMQAEKYKQESVHVDINSGLKLLGIETDTCNSKAMALNRRIEEIDHMIGTKDV